MKSIFSFLILMILSSVSYADNLTFTMSNSNMISMMPNEGLVEFSPIDPLNLNGACNQIIAPNSCQIIGSSLRITLAFNYGLTYNFSEGGTVNVFFAVENGTNGLGSFQNVQVPTSLMSLHSGSSGVANLTFDIPVNSGVKKFSMDLEADLVLNP